MVANGRIGGVDVVAWMWWQVLNIKRGGIGGVDVVAGVEHKEGWY